MIASSPLSPAERLPALRWRPSWRLSTRLSLAFGLVLGLLLVITAVALHRMQRIDAHTTRMTEVNYNRMAVMQGMMNAVNEITVAMLNVMLVTDQEDAQIAQEQIGQGIARYRQAREQLQALTQAPGQAAEPAATAAGSAAAAPAAAPAPEPEGAADAQASTTDAPQGSALDEIDRVAVLGLDRAQYVRETLQSGNTNLDNIFRARNPRPLQDTWLGLLMAQAQQEAKDAAAQKAAIQDEFALARQWLLGVAAMALVLSVVAGTLILRSVTRPLAQAIGHAQRIAQGDLTGEIVAARSDETGDLLAALARMQLQLRSLVSSINASAGGITLASREIAQGNQDLSVRTEQAASDLQSTALSVGALAGVVRASADSAAQADALARQAAGAARQGGEAVASVVTVMDEILSGARRIADIVGVIDSIAFQTNILALNAAVEAAHAGAQGRGFAVVATEVRSLAQRVVAAAHDIKQLIDRSLVSADNGAQLARNAGDTMQRIVTSVHAVTTTIGEVASAAGTQSTGIEEVSAAVARLDDMTQRNAALVEESAAAAQALEQQAVQLEDLVGAFRAAPAQKYQENRSEALVGQAPVAIGLIAA